MAHLQYIYMWPYHVDGSPGGLPRRAIDASPVPLELLQVSEGDGQAGRAALGGGVSNTGVRFWANRGLRKRFQDGDIHLEPTEQAPAALGCAL